MTAAGGDFVAVAPADQVPEGALKVFQVKDRRIAVSRLGGEFHAIDDLCTHDDGPLGEGQLQGDEVECPRHGARFNVKTGAAVSMPAVVPVKVHRVRVQDGQIQVEIKA
ncbi:MAG: non-heme iron oxygenase ferredoxin subunit [Elusimicrobiota bacterium]